MNPGGDTAVFRIEAADDILRLLADAHETEFTIAELVDATNVARSTVWRAVTDVVADLSERWFDGDRFDFEPYVESEESAQRAGEKLREIFVEGITVYGDDRLQSIRKAVFASE